MTAAKWAEALAMPVGELGNNLDKHAPVFSYETLEGAEADQKQGIPS